MNNVIIVHVSFSFTSVILNSRIKLYVFDDGRKNSSESSCYAYIYCYFYVFTQVYKSLKYVCL